MRARRIWRLVLAALPITLVALIAFGTASLSSRPASVAPRVAAPARTGLPDGVGATLLDDATSFNVSAIEQCGDAWFDAYVASRIVNSVPGVTFDLKTPKTPVAYDAKANATYGPWTAPADFGATDARADGSITEWADHYYITHDWSEFGQQILGMRPGDRVTINGTTMVVQGILDYPKDSFYEEITRIADNATLILQTCIPGEDYNRIVFGS